MTQRKKIRRLYYSLEWFDFSKKVKKRDNFQCVHCKRTEREVTLQVHHIRYVSELSPWEYPLSDCITLCKGCHAREHKLIEPSKGWTLFLINDLGDCSGHCELKGCGAGIRFEHLIYHPDWGYKIVGSSCVENLTQEDKELSAETLEMYRKISQFVHSSIWTNGYTRTGKFYIQTKYKHHLLRIYGKKNRFAFQVALKVKGERWFDFQDFVLTKNKTLYQVKEMAFITLNGKLTINHGEKRMLGHLYKSIL